jgi:hypothetical protein
MMKKFLALVLVGFFAMAAHSQNDFLLYSFKGNVSVVENNVEAKAKVGKPLTAKSTIKVAAGSTVTLICNQAAMFTLTKAGTYPLSKFGDSCRVSSNSVSANYVKYVWASMTQSGGSSGSNRKAYMNTVGATTRDMNSIWFDPRMRLDTLNYSGIANDFPLSWKCFNPDAKEYEFSLFTSDNISTPVHTVFVNKLKIPIADFSKKMKPGSSYYWTVAVKGEENDKLLYINYVDKDNFKTMIESFKAQAPAVETPAEQHYRIAFMLEDGHYLAEAYDYYSKAVKLDPSNGLYRTTLMSFKKDYEIK